MKWKKKQEKKLKKKLKMEQLAADENNHKIPMEGDLKVEVFYFVIWRLYSMNTV